MDGDVQECRAHVGLVHNVSQDDGVVGRGREVSLLLGDGVRAVGVLDVSDDGHGGSEDCRVAIGKTMSYIISRNGWTISRRSENCSYNGRMECDVQDLEGCSRGIVVTCPNKGILGLRHYRSLHIRERDMINVERVREQDSKGMGTRYVPHQRLSPPGARTLKALADATAEAMREALRIEANMSLNSGVTRKRNGGYEGGGKERTRSEHGTPRGECCPQHMASENRPFRHKSATGNGSHITRSSGLWTSRDIHGIRRQLRRTTILRTSASCVTNSNYDFIVEHDEVADKYASSNTWSCPLFSTNLTALVLPNALRLALRSVSGYTPFPAQHIPHSPPTIRSDTSNQNSARPQLSPCISADVRLHRRRPSRRSENQRGYGSWRPLGRIRARRVDD